METELHAKTFKLRLASSLIPEDGACPDHTVMAVTVYSDGFCASAFMETDIRELAVFAENLCRIYNTLSGIARIEEPYGLHMYLQFTGDGRGHIAVSGALHGGNRKGNQHHLEFENQIDQTELKPFCFTIRESCGARTR